MDFSGTFVVKSALEIAPRVFVRPGELRKAEWERFDLDKAEWRYFVTKTKAEHLVPLASQVVATLRENGCRNLCIAIGHSFVGFS